MLTENAENVFPVCSVVGMGRQTVSLVKENSTTATSLCNANTAMGWQLLQTALESLQKCTNNMYTNTQQDVRGVLLTCVLYTFCHSKVYTTATLTHTALSTLLAANSSGHTHSTQYTTGSQQLRPHSLGSLSGNLFLFWLYCAWASVWLALCRELTSCRV